MMDVGRKDTLEKGGSAFAAAIVIVGAAIKAAYWHLPSCEMCRWAIYKCAERFYISSSCSDLRVILTRRGESVQYCKGG